MKTDERLLRENEAMKKDDEWQSPITGEWKKIPENWIGCKVIHDNSTTFDRQNIKVRRRK